MFLCLLGGRESDVLDVPADTFDIGKAATLCPLLTRDGGVSRTGA